MPLVEAGKFDLGKSVAAQLPEPLDHSSDYRDIALELVHDPRWPRVTPRMLLSHSSGLAYGLGWGLLTRTPYGQAYFNEGHGDRAQNDMICFPQRRICMVLLTNSDNGELAFRPLLKKILEATSAAASIFHQRHIGRVLRSSRGDPGRRFAS